MKRILITGATGLIGTHLCKQLSERGDVLTIFSRYPDKAKSKLPFADEYVKWDYKKPGEWKNHLNKKDIVVHLAGANLAGKRWTDDYKKKIIESREISTRNLINAVGEAEEKPDLFICASGINYYGNKGDDILTEESSNGHDFLAKVCQIWESEASRAEAFNIRWISIRTGAVLTPDEGALKKFLTPFKFFIGGPLGTGNQWFSWIHIDDIVRGYIFLIDNESLKGPVNVSSPNPVRMKEFADTLGNVLNRPSFLRVPEAVLKIVAGEMAVTVTGSLRVKPQKLEENNFNFRYENLSGALKNLLK